MTQSGPSVRVVPVLLVIAVGGVLGSLGRYGLAVALGEWDGASLPWATLTVNLVGCLAIGIAATRLARADPSWLRPFLITGVLGGFTTFSAFALETGVLLDAGKWGVAAAYVLATMVLGLLAVRLGTALAGRPS